jgi:hypothetical protein
MATQAEVKLLYVQDTEPAFMWADGRVIPTGEAARRQRIFGVLGQTVREARVDRQTTAGRIVWGHTALVVEIPLPGEDRSGRPLLLTMAILGDTHTADWHDRAIELADAKLTAHGLETDRGRLEAVLREAQRSRPGPLLAWWLDGWHFLERAWRLAAKRVSVQVTPQPDSLDPAQEQEMTDGPS